MRSRVAGEPPRAELHQHTATRIGPVNSLLASPPPLRYRFPLTDTTVHVRAQRLMNKVLERLSRKKRQTLRCAALLTPSSRSPEMKLQPRLQLLRAALQAIEGQKGAFVIFTTDCHEAFIQFASNDEEPGVVADIPDIDLSEDEAAKIPSEFRREEYDEFIAFRKDCTVAGGAETTEWFFRTICTLPDDYSVKVELESGETFCDLCGHKIAENAVVSPPDMDPSDARRLGMSETRIAKLIDEHILHVTQEVGDSTDKLAEQIALIKEDGPIFPTLCRKCRKRAS